MAFNPMMNPGFGGGVPGMGGGGGGLMGQLGRGMQDGSLVGRERGIASHAVMDAKMTEAMAKMDGVVTPQERMAIMQKKFKASHMMNHLRTNGMGNVSGEAMARQQMGMGGPGGFGGPGGGFGPGFGGPGFGGPPGLGGVGPVGAQALSGGGSVSMSMAWSTGGGTATAQAGNALAQAGPNGATARVF